MIVGHGGNITCIFHFLVVKFVFHYLEAEQKDRSYHVSSYSFDHYMILWIALIVIWFWFDLFRLFFIILKRRQIILKFSRYWNKWKLEKKFYFISFKLLCN